MSNLVLLKRSSVASKIPATTDLQLGELALNTFDGKVFLKKNNGVDGIVEVGAVTTVAGRTGAVVLANSDVGLGSVENKSSSTIRSEITSGNVTTALGFTPVNSAIVGAANGVATLDATGKIVTSQLPAITITDTFVVASQAAMLALTVQTGDVAVRTDLNKSFIVKGADGTLIGNWQELLTPTDAVLSVNGQIGAVTLTSTSVAEGTNLYFTNARASSAAPVQTVAGRTGAVVLAVADVSGAAPLASPALTGVPTAPTALSTDSTTAIATTAFVKAQSYITSAGAPVQSVAGRTGAVVLAVADVSGAAPLASPALTGTPTAPTPLTADNSTLIATTAFIKAQGYATTAGSGALAPVQSVAGRTGAVVLAVADVSGAAPLASPALTGTPTAPTALSADSTTAIATTAFVKAQSYITSAGAPVQSVAGRSGAVVLTTSDVAEGTNLYYTNARASAAAPVQTVAGRSGAVVLTMADVSGTVDGGAF